MTAERLHAFRENYERRGAIDTDDYRSLIERLTLLGRGLDVETTRNYVVAAAKKGDFVSYSELAKLYGLDWSKIRFKMNEHLEHVCEDSYKREGVLLSAIVVNAQNTNSGRLDPVALDGFAKFMRKFATVPPGDEQRMLHAEQQKVFAHYDSETNS